MFKPEHDSHVRVVDGVLHVPSRRTDSVRSVHAQNTYNGFSKISSLADPEASTRDLPRDIFGELDLPESLCVSEIRFSSRGDECDTLPKGGTLHGPAQKMTRLSEMCGLRVSNPQLGAMPKVALVLLRVNDDFKGHPSTILGPRRQVTHLYL